MLVVSPASLVARLLYWPVGVSALVDLKDRRDDMDLRDRAGVCAPLEPSECSCVSTSARDSAVEKPTIGDIDVLAAIFCVNLPFTIQGSQRGALLEGRHALRGDMFYMFFITRFRI